MNDLQSFLEAGGPVLFGILVVSVVLCSLIAERYWFFKRDAMRICQQHAQRWKLRKNRHGWHAQKIREAMISDVAMRFEQHLPVIKLTIMLCPLLGLLGTVTGMIQVFDVMAITGTGNARAMASGISQATIPTMAGMVVSLIGIYFKTRFDGMAKKQLEIFQDRLVKNVNREGAL